jgi:glycosyltransferase involved in cell wall biosynthesis
MPQDSVIVHVIPGGSENRLLQNIVSTATENFGVIALSSPDQFIEDWARLQKLSYWNLNLNLSLKKPFSVIVAAIKMHQLLRKVKPTHVYFHSFIPSLLSTLIFFFRKDSVFIPVRHHNIVHHILKKTIYIQLDRFIGCFSDAIVAVSNSVKETMGAEKTRLSKVHVIFNAMKFERYERTRIFDGETPKLLAIGRIDWQKNYPALIQMVFLVKQKYPGVKLEILGDGNLKLKADLQDQIMQLDLDSNIDFLGWRDNVSDYLAKADLFVHSALDEACPLVLLEALAAEIPIVSTGNGGCKDVLEGFYELVDTSDSRIFADAVLNALHETVLSNARAKEIRLLALHKFNVPKMSKEYVDLTFRVRSKN